MKEISFSMPGYKISEYKLVLDPHPELSSRISDIRNEFANQFKVSAIPGLKVNLVLARFTQHEMMESRIVNYLEKIALGYPPFKVELKDFGSYPTHSIFIHVTSKLPVQGLVRQIRSETQKLMKLDNDHKPWFEMEPNFLIATKLNAWQYEKGWLDYSHKHFTGRFIAAAMLLLKRSPEERPWQIVKRFDFQNLPVKTKQGELF